MIYAQRVRLKDIVHEESKKTELTELKTEDAKVELNERIETVGNNQDAHNEFIRVADQYVGSPKREDDARSVALANAEDTRKSIARVQEENKMTATSEIVTLKSHSARGLDADLFGGRVSTTTMLKEHEDSMNIAVPGLSLRKGRDRRRPALSPVVRRPGSAPSGTSLSYGVHQTLHENEIVDQKLSPRIISSVSLLKGRDNDHTVEIQPAGSSKQSGVEPETRSHRSLSAGSASSESSIETNELVPAVQMYESDWERLERWTRAVRPFTPDGRSEDTVGGGAFFSEQKSELRSTGEGESNEEETLDNTPQSANDSESVPLARATGALKGSQAKLKDIGRYDIQHGKIPT